MRKVLVLAYCLCAVSLFHVTNTTAKNKSTHKGSWQLAWSEEFNESSIDQSKWSKIPRGGAEWGKYMTNADTCYKVENSCLVLRGIVNPNKSDTAHYLTGGVWTKGKMDFSYGRIEIKAKYTNAKGYWPAIWMLPENERWPNGGEIDIMEHLNHDSIAYQTIHSYYTYRLKIKDKPKNGSINTVNPTGFNIYTLDYYPDSLVMSVNHHRTFAYPRIKTSKKGQFPFSKPFYLLIDSQLGGGWVGSVDPKELPVEMDVDWVRYYKRL